MQPKLGDSTLFLYNSLIKLVSSGYKPEINNISSIFDFWPVFWDGSDIKRSIVFYFTFALFDIGPIAYFDVVVEDLDIDWEYLNFNLGYEIMDIKRWKDYNDDCGKYCETEIQ